jgi:hypothetical protein
MEQLVPVRYLASAITVCAASLAIAGCGSSSTPQSAGSVPQSVSTQAAVAAQRPARSANASNLDIGQGTQQLSEKAKQPTVSRGRKVQRGRLQTDDEGTVQINKMNPCKLVSLHEAKLITGGAVVKTLVAPLGPTCVYRLAHRRSSITLAVETSSYRLVSHSITKGERLKISGRKALCGQLGSPTLYAELPGGRVLHVIAPCPIAQQFAAKALRRL